MDSIVLELQRKAWDKDSDVGELVRLALVVAQKLGVKDFQEWAERELRGYHDDAVTLPAYRICNAETKVFNPELGLIPLTIHDASLAAAANQAKCRNSIGELQYMMKHIHEGDVFQHPYDPEIRELLMNRMDGERFVPTRVIPISRLAGVLDATRNLVLEWSLHLEQEGVLGEGMTFSAEEKEKATQASSIHIGSIGSVNGVIGNIQTNQIQIGDYGSIHNELKALGIPQDDRNQLENIVDEFNNTIGKKKESLAKRGLEWVANHAETLGKIASVIRTWFITT